MSKGNVIGCTGTGVRQFSGILSVTDISGGNIATFSSNSIVLGNTLDVPTVSVFSPLVSMAGIGPTFRITDTALGGWDINISAGNLIILPTGSITGSAIAIVKAGTVITNIIIGNNNDDPSISFLGQGGLGFHGNTPVLRATVSGSKGGNAALGSLMTALNALGLVTDATT